MSIFSRFRRRKDPYRAATDEEQISRYIYLLNTLPASVIESAHASAFREVPAQRRREMFEQLRPFMSDAERTVTPGDPHLLATLVRRAERRAQRAAGDEAAQPPARTVTATSERNDYLDPRDMMLQSGVMAIVAYQFVTTTAVAAYFTVGAGSLVISDQPGWVGDIVDPGSSGIDASASGGFDGGGGGYDSGGFGGGYDGGGFGGGFGGFDGGGGGFG